MKLKIISGGQTGADMGGLLAARDLGIETGGTAPKGWLQEGGAKEELLKSFGLVEWQEEGYPARTKENVRNSDFTLIFCKEMSAGTKCTMAACSNLKKPNRNTLRRPYHCINPFTDFSGIMTRESLSQAIRNNRDKEVVTINIAGHRESTHPGIQRKVYELLVEVLTELMNGDKSL